MRKSLVIGIVFLSTLFIAGTVYSEEKPKRKLYLKSGTVIECDTVSEGLGDFILIQKSHGTLGYWKTEVDLVKTFGETRGKEIAATDEKRKKEIQSLSEALIDTAELEEQKRILKENHKRQLAEIDRRYERATRRATRDKQAAKEITTHTSRSWPVEKFRKGYTVDANNNLILHYDDGNRHRWKGIVKR